MSDFFLGQVMMTGFGFAQKYFAKCDGQLLPIAQNSALFSLLGTYYGGDGKTTFALPDLRSRTPIGGGFASVQGWNPPLTDLGEPGGSETVTLTAAQLPMHNHMVTVSSTPGTGGRIRGTANTLGASAPDGEFLYGPSGALIPLAAGPLTATGGSQPHANIQPYLAINFNIALSGIYPSRN